MADFQLTPHQGELFTRLQSFVTDKAHQVFLLKGYAGTGKTTLVRFLLRWLEDNQPDVTPILLASTGRAAKVLARKTGVEATTVHSHIYAFTGVDDGGAASDEDYAEDMGQLSLNFGLRQRDEEENPGTSSLYIVDEASMLSHLESSGDSGARFGSGSMLSDFFHFIDGRQLIFIGDPVQLPPPIGNEPFSSALDAGFLAREYKLKVTQGELRKVIRQALDNPVLALATRLREELTRKEKPGDWQLLMKDKTYPFFNPYTQQVLADRFLAATKNDYARALIITHSNKQTHYLNEIVRTKRFGKKKLHRLQRHELLQVVQNNPLTGLANGDQVLVRDARPLGRSAGFFFLTIKAEDIHTGQVYEVPILYDFLFETRANIGGDDFRKLLIDFDRRARKRGLKRKSQDYREAMQKDPYLNALRAKFGYAVTCHKAQGGEWDTVFINLSKSLDLLPPESRFRWLYTAVTRAAVTLELKQVWQGNKPSSKRKKVTIR